MLYALLAAVGISGVGGSLALENYFDEDPQEPSAKAEMDPTPLRPAKPPLPKDAWMDKNGILTFTLAPEEGKQGRADVASIASFKVAAVSRSGRTLDLPCKVLSRNGNTVELQLPPPQSTGESHWTMIVPGADKPVSIDAVPPTLGTVHPGDMNWVAVYVVGGISGTEVSPGARVTLGVPEHVLTSTEQPSQ